MVKSIKKSVKYIVIFLGIIIALPTIFYFILRIPVVQTMIVRRITDHISEETRSSIMIGKVEFHFFNRLYMNDILIKDQNNDTLIYSQKISAGIRKIDLKKKAVKLRRVIIDSPVVAFAADSAGTLNVMWYIDKLRTRKDTLKKEKVTIDINQIDINNARFSLVNDNNAKSKAPLDLSNLHLSKILLMMSVSIFYLTDHFSLFPTCTILFPI